MATRILYQEESCKDEIFEDHSIILKNQPNTLEELKNILYNLMETNQSTSLKEGLEIMTTLISHKKKEVVASALGELFLMINDETIQKLVVKELMTLSHNHNPDVRKSAAYSLELISSEVYKLEIVNKLLNLFFNLKENINNKIKPFQTCYILSYHLINGFYSYLSSIYTKTNNLLFIHHFYYLENFFNTLATAELILFEENVNSPNEQYYNNEKVYPYSDIMNIDHTTEDPLNTLATIYAQTFLEKGQLRRLKALLDDENSEVQHSGLNGLTYVANVLIKIEK